MATTEQGKKLNRTGEQKIKFKENHKETEQTKIMSVNPSTLSVCYICLFGRPFYCQSVNVCHLICPCVRSVLCFHLCESQQNEMPYKFQKKKPAGYQYQTFYSWWKLEDGGGAYVEIGTKLTLHITSHLDLENRTYKHDPASIPFVFALSLLLSFCHRLVNDF